MASAKGSSNLRNMPYTGKQSLLPPKSPFPSFPPSYADYGSSSGTKGIPKPREGHRHHQRTSSESFLIEEQPSWVDELLDEPETPVRRGHRRSSSDSFAYVDAVNASNLDNLLQERYKWNLSHVPSRESPEFDHYKDLPQMSFYKEPNSFGKQQNRAWESSLGSVTYASGLPSSSDNILLQGSVSSCAPLESDAVPSLAIGKQNQEESCPHDPKSTLDRRDCPQIKPSPSESDQKRVKQQFAQRSRVRKLQYIAELERNVQVLQAEGTEVSAELEFLDRQNLILNMENKALKQRLDSLAQEQVIKYLEQEMLEREIARLRTLYQQQQQPPPPPSSSSTSHHRSNSRDLDSRFANLSLKQKDAGSGHDPLHT